MRKEMESRNELEKAKLQMELDKLRLSSPVSIPTVTMVEEDLQLGSPGAENDPYNIMKSIAFEPVIPKKRTKSFNIMDITGGRQIHHPNGSPRPENDPYNVMESIAFGPIYSKRQAKSLHITRGRQVLEPNDCEMALHFSHSPSPQFETHLPPLSPATGQHNAAALQSPDDSEMGKLLDTYEVISKEEEHSALPPTNPVDNGSEGSEFDIGYVSRNMSKFQVENGPSCPAQMLEPTAPATDHPDGDLAHEQ